MRKRTGLAVAALCLVLAAAAFADTHWVRGKVTKVDIAAQKLTIRHEALKKFDMEDGHTMVFRVKDPALLKEVKPGDDIRFDADKIDGKFTVTEIKKGK
jgi:Cu(I)/Ag(I) efflux system periplasmic protein CusF